MLSNDYSIYKSFSNRNMPWWLISVHKAGHKEPSAWLSAVMEGRKWEALVKLRIIDQCIQWSVSWAGNKLPGVSNIAVSRVKFHFCDLCRGKHNLLTKQYRIFSTMSCSWHFVIVYSKNSSCVPFIHKFNKWNSFWNSWSHLSMLEINSVLCTNNSEM